MIYLISEISPKGSSGYALLDDAYVRGSYHIVDTMDDMEAISIDRRKVGMLCYVVNLNTMYQLGSDLETWDIFNAGGGGSSWTYVFGYGLNTDTDVSSYLKKISVDSTKVFSIVSSYSALPTDVTEGVYYTLNDYADEILGDIYPSGFYKYNSETSKWEKTIVGQTFDNSDTLEKFSESTDGQLLFSGNPIQTELDNQNVIDKFSEDSSGNLLYDGKSVGMDIIDDTGSPSLSKVWSSYHTNQEITELIADDEESSKRTYSSKKLENTFLKIADQKTKLSEFINDLIEVETENINFETDPWS